jgi:hypothetical protein
MANDRANGKALLRGIAVVFGLGLSSLPTVCKAANTCPWINEATASGLLGGEAVGAATGLDGGATAVCEFTLRGEGFKRTLRVTVELAPDPHARLSDVAQICGSDAEPLKAIGNEALVCKADDRKTGLGERVAGRVRNQVFTITIKTTMKADPILTREELKNRIGTAAEQVSGNLF